MNITELRLKVKEAGERLNNRELYTVLLIIAVGFGSFGLGRLSKLQEGKTPIRIEQASAAVLASPPAPLQRGSTEVSRGRGGDSSTVPTAGGLPSVALAKGGQLVASKGGTKYHFPWCSGAQRISEANKVWFDSVEEARKAGYTPASNCKGLK